MIVLITCCKDCEKRQIGCHSTCEEYIAQAKRLKKEREIDRQNKLCDYAQYDRILKSYKRKYD